MIVCTYLAGSGLSSVTRTQAAREKPKRVAPGGKQDDQEKEEERDADHGQRTAGQSVSPSGPLRRQLVALPMPTTRRRAQ